jgi:hypothetical protein
VENVKVRKKKKSPRDWGHDSNKTKQTKTNLKKKTPQKSTILTNEKAEMQFPNSESKKKREKW